MKIHVRWMIRRDVPEVLAISKQSSLPWSEDELLQSLRHRNNIGMVAEQGEKVIGFMVYELHKHKLSVLNFAVEPIVKRLGIGAQMMAKIINKLSSHRRNKITAEVPEKSLDLQLFLRSQGFLAVQVMKPWQQEEKYLFEYTFVEQEKALCESQIGTNEQQPDFEENLD